MGFGFEKDTIFAPNPTSVPMKTLLCMLAVLLLWACGSAPEQEALPVGRKYKSELVFKKGLALAVWKIEVDGVEYLVAAKGESVSIVAHRSKMKRQE